MLWEATNRERGVVPDETTFERLRPAAGAVPSFFALIAPLEQIPQFARPEALVELAELAGRIVCWTNDVLSYDKEKEHNDVHNLIMVLAHHRNLSEGEAAAAAVEVVNLAVRGFHGLAERLYEGGVTDPQKQYMETLESVIASTRAWTFESVRYSQLDSGLVAAGAGDGGRSR